MPKFKLLFPYRAAILSVVLLTGCMATPASDACFPENGRLLAVSPPNMPNTYFSYLQGAKYELRVDTAKVPDLPVWDRVKSAPPPLSIDEAVERAAITLPEFDVQHAAWRLSEVSLVLLYPFDEHAKAYYALQYLPDGKCCHDSLTLVVYFNGKVEKPVATTPDSAEKERGAQLQAPRTR